MRTITWETASQITLRNCFREVERKVNIYVILVKGNYMQSSTYFSRSSLLISMKLSFCKSQEIVITMKDFGAFLDKRRYKNWAHKIST